jgi:hypothetical protein
LRALDQKTGQAIHEMELPANETGLPMTCQAGGRHSLSIVVAVGVFGFPATRIALALPWTPAR